MDLPGFALSDKATIVDSTVQEKAIAHPTDSKLLERARQHLVKLAPEGGLALRQNYNREAPKLAAQIGRYAHAKQYTRMRPKPSASPRVRLHGKQGDALHGPLRLRPQSAHDTAEGAASSDSDRDSAITASARGSLATVAVER